MREEPKQYEVVIVSKPVKIPTIQGRLRDAEDRFLKWAYKKPYSGPPVLSIPRHPDNVDAIMAEAADMLDEAVDALAELVESLEAIDAASERAEKNGGRGWSSASVVRSLYAREQARATLAKLTPQTKTTPPE